MLINLMLNETAKIFSCRDDVAIKITVALLLLDIITVKCQVPGQIIMDL